MQTLKSTLTSYFKYFAIINLARKTNALVVVDLLASSCICTWNKLIRAQTISPLPFFFFKFFSDTKTLNLLVQKQPLGLFYKKAVPISFGICIGKCVGSLFNEIVGLQDCCKIYLLYSHLRFYYYLGKTLKNFINFQ